MRISLMVFGFNLCILTSIIHAQKKFGYQWVFGYDGGTIMNFNENPVRIDSCACIGYFDTANTGICNSEGDIQFYVNGCQIVNGNHKYLENGESLAPGWFSDSYCKGGGLPSHQGFLALPMPNIPHKYYVIYYGSDWIAKYETLKGVFLYYALIDMSQNNGLGEVVKKDNVILRDTFSRGFIQAVRHANGRDWWVLFPDGKGTNCYYYFILSPNGISQVQRQCIGEPWNVTEGLGQAVFSPDGTKYAMAKAFDGIRIYDFDRCTGLLSNAVSIQLPDSNLNLSGAAFSPNSRYFYHSARTKLFQFDTYSADIEASRILIDTFDGKPFPYYGVFNQCYLGPDGKIYISGASSHKHLHVINQPNNPGLACDFRQHGISIPTFNYHSLPNMPHFQLGALIGSSCDSLTLSTSNLIQKESITLLTYPNPVINYINIVLETDKAFDGQLQLVDPWGRNTRQMVHHFESGRNTVSLDDLQGLSKGMWWLSLVNGSGCYTIKFVKQ